MNEAPFQEWASRLLEDQHARLGELRNGNPRDGGFKLWRQTTLTVIQRLWPGNLQRSERFRRIAFSAPGGKPTREQVAEFYERGCGEASDYLRELMQEVSDGALDPPQTAEAQNPESALDSRPLLEVDVETDDFAPMEFMPTVMKPEEESEPEEEFESEEQEDVPVNPVPLVIPPVPTAARPAPATGTGGRRLLKEMLGFMDETRPSPVVPAAPAEPLSASDAEDDWMEVEESPSPPQESNGGEAGLEESAGEILHSPAVFTAPAKSFEAPRTVASPLKSATGNALVALASEVAALGVPEGHRAAARAALIDLGHQFDRRSANWDSLRHVVAMVMEYPELARRVVPMLVPYLDLL